jgi:anaerobic selenocysteine-containing dehydrogenase
LLVRADNGKFLTHADLSAGGSPRKYVAWSESLGRPILYDPASGAYEGDHPEPALFGAFTVEAKQGPLACHPIFELTAGHCLRYPPERVKAITGVGREQVEAAARMLWDSRPLAYYAWSGVEMQTNATQIARAIAQLSVLTGSFDAPGGNVLFPRVPAAGVDGGELLPPGQRLKALGLQERPLGPSRWQYVTTDELYRAILEQQPYGAHALVDFGSNLLLSHADGRRGRQALAALDFYVHADLFMNPTAELADIVLPVASAFERENLKIGFEISAGASSLLQLRQQVVAPRGEARSDTEIVFDLATRLGLGEHFWGGDIQAAYRYQLAPSGVSLEALRQQPGGVRVPQPLRYHRYAEQVNGAPRGFNTPTRKIELYSEMMLKHGNPPLPEFEEPLMSPISRPDLAEHYPLILTCAKNTLFCESQHRALPSLRRPAMDPEVELHPQAAAERGIHPGDWVRIETPDGSVRARARLNDSLKPDVVCGQHGWWQACEEIGAPAYDAFSANGANFNLVIGNAAIDPVSGSVPHRAYICQVRLAN